MQCIFNQPRKIGGKIYAKCDPKSKKAVKVDDAHASHWFFKEMVKCGDIVIVGDAPKVKDTKDSETPSGSKSKAAAAKAAAEAEKDA